TRCDTNGCSVPSSSSGSPWLELIGDQACERGGRNRATRAAPDCALPRMPWRCLYHCGIAPRLRRQFFLGWRYTGPAVETGSSAVGLASSGLSAAQLFSRSEAAELISLETVCSTLRAASSNCVFIFLSSSSSMERFTSALTSAT